MARQSRRRLRPGEVKAVVFDAYGTVINFTEPDFIATMAEICADQSLDADASDLWRRFLRASYLMRSEHHHDPVYQRYDEAWARQFEYVFNRLKLQGDPWAGAEYIRRKLASAVAFPEVYPVLEALRPRYRLAVVSNSDDDFLTEALQRNNLRFDTVVTSERARAVKPNPAIFQHLVERLGLEPRQVLCVGDNPIPDVLGPRRAGLKVAWVNRQGVRRPRNVPPPDIRVRTLSELLPLLVPAPVPSPDA